MLFFVVATSLLTVLSAESCEDLVHPRTGVSDCPKRATLCKDPIYNEVMTWQCPKTCGFCPATTTSSGTGATSTKPCVDKVNPATGVSECAAKADLCNNKVYYTLMTDQCPKTCGRCTGTVTTASSTCVDKVNPKTGVSDCTKMASYCNNSAVLKTPLDDMNRAAATFFCGEAQEQCKSEFATVIEITGLLGKIIRKKKSIDEACRVMRCKG